MTNWIDTAKRWIGGLTEIGLLLVGIGIVLQILFGDNVGFISEVISNLVGVVRELGNNGLFGLIALAIILWIFAKRVL